MDKLGFSTKETIAILGSQKLFLRAKAAGWIKPHITTGPGGINLYSEQSIRELWDRFSRELPPKLPCEMPK